MIRKPLLHETKPRADSKMAIGATGQKRAEIACCKSVIKTNKEKLKTETDPKKIAKINEIIYNNTKILERAEDFIEREKVRAEKLTQAEACKAKVLDGR